MPDCLISNKLLYNQGDGNAQRNRIYVLRARLAI